MDSINKLDIDKQFYNNTNSDLLIIENDLKNIDLLKSANNNLINNNYLYKQNFSQELNDINNNKFNFIEEIDTKLTNGNGVLKIYLGCSINEKYKEGINMKEYDDSISFLNKICTKYNYNYKIINKNALNRFNEDTKYFLEILLTKEKFLFETNYYNKKSEIKIGMFGDKSSGKSTLIGVIVDGILDNGEGLARSNIYRFQHEHFTGKTSNFSHYVYYKIILYLYINKISGYDINGTLLNTNKLNIKFNGETKDIRSRLFWEEIIRKSNKILSFYDMGGSSKFSVKILLLSLLIITHYLNN